MLVVGTESSQWCHNNPVLQLQVAQLEGLEEIRRHVGDSWRRTTLIGNVELPNVREKAAEYSGIRRKTEKRADLSATSGMRKTTSYHGGAHDICTLVPFNAPTSYHGSPVPDRRDCSA
jgi:hypothetical protein